MEGQVCRCAVDVVRGRRMTLWEWGHRTRYMILHVCLYYDVIIVNRWLLMWYSVARSNAPWSYNVWRHLMLALCCSETAQLDKCLTIELWNKGMLWDNLVGVQYLPLTNIKFSNKVRARVGVTSLSACLDLSCCFLQHWCLLLAPVLSKFSVKISFLIWNAVIIFRNLTRVRL